MSDVGYTELVEVCAVGLELALSDSRQNDKVGLVQSESKYQGIYNPHSETENGE